jgi:hypothetical protein
MNELGSDDVLAFLHAIDDELARHAAPGEILSLYLIGSAALIVRYGLRLATKDVDIVHFDLEVLEAKAIDLFGGGTPNAQRWGFYLEEVPQGLPPIPQGYCGRCEPIAGAWKVLRPMQPKPHDLAVTKLKRFHAKDRQDLRILCETGDLDANRLREAFESAFMFTTDDDPDREEALANLETVIRFLEGEAAAL